MFLLLLHAFAVQWNLTCLGWKDLFLASATHWICHHQVKCVKSITQKIGAYWGLFGTSQGLLPCLVHVYLGTEVRRFLVVEHVKMRTSIPRVAACRCPCCGGDCPDAAYYGPFIREAAVVNVVNEM